MKKILLLCSLVIPFLLGGCSNKIDGPKNNYYQNYKFRRTAGEYGNSLIDEYNYFNSEVSNISEVEEKYEYSNGKEDFTSYEANTEFFDTATSADPYVLKRNDEYSHKITGSDHDLTEGYASETYRWNTSFNAILTVEKTNKDGQETINRSAKYQKSDEAFKEHFVEPFGEAYYDRKDRLCYYTSLEDITNTDDANGHPYRYSRREQIMFVYDYSRSYRLLQYHYYNEVVSNRDPETGNYYKKDRLISYHYQEINYDYSKERQKQNISGLNRMMDGFETLLRFDIIEYVYPAYLNANGEYDISRSSYASEKVDSLILSNGEDNKYIHQFVIDCHDTYFFGGGAPDAHAYAYEAEVEFLSGTTATMELKTKFNFLDFKDKLEQHGYKVVKTSFGQCLIYVGDPALNPKIRVTATLSRGEATRFDFNVDVFYPNYD